MSPACTYCGYRWISRMRDPKECPRCKTRNWKSPCGPRAQELYKLNEKTPLERERERERVLSDPAPEPDQLKVSDLNRGGI
jgi:hypothetical protein